MNDMARGAIFCAITGLVLVLLLSAISWHNNRVPWPAMDNPKTEGTKMPMSPAGERMNRRMLAAIFGPHTRTKLPNGTHVIRGGDEQCGFSMVDPEDNWFASPKKRERIAQRQHQLNVEWSRKHPGEWPRCEICYHSKANCICGTWVNGESR